MGLNKKYTQSNLYGKKICIRYISNVKINENAYSVVYISTFILFLYISVCLKMEIVSHLIHVFLYLKCHKAPVICCNAEF